MTALIHQGRHDDVLAQFRASLTRSRHVSQAQVMRAVSLLNSMRLTEAADALTSWRGPQDAEVDYLWAFLHALRGETSSARTRLEQCLAKEPALISQVAANQMLRSLHAKRGSQTGESASA